jgi:hypothetical protein
MFRSSRQFVVEPVGKLVQNEMVMVDRHGISGASIPNRSARRVLASGLVLLCALVHAAARADEPGRLRPLPPVTTDEVRRYEPTTATPPMGMPAFRDEQPGGSILFGNDNYGVESPYAGRQVDFVAADRSTDGPAEQYRPVALRSGKSLLNFAGMQGTDDSAPASGGAGASSDDEPNGGSDEKAAGASGEKKEGEQTFGQAPTNNSLQFLRQVDVLLKKGAWQADTGFIYTHFSNDFPLAVFNGSGEVVDVVEAEVRRRLLYTPLAVRYGLRKNIQLFASLPAGFSNTQFSTIGISETTNVSGIGDLTSGASFHLLRGEELMPDVIGTFGFTAPTGKFTTPLFGLVPGSNLGQGFWALSGQLLFINRYDPIIVFYGGGYRHLFEREFDGVLFAPGEQINYMLGVGFSVNDRVTLSSSFQGFYITNSFVNSTNVRGSNLEPLSLRFSVTTVRNCRIVEPFVQFGITDSAPRVNVGLVVTFY